MDYTQMDNPNNDLMIEAYNVLLEYKMNCMKYKTLWELRNLEKEINESDGILIIHANETVTHKGFTDIELSDRIQLIIQTMKKM